MEKETHEKIKNMIKLHALIFIYIIQILFIIMYTEPEIQPFVYVRF